MSNTSRASSTSSSPNNANTINPNLSVGVGVVSFSSSNIPFSQSTSNLNQNGNNNNNSTHNNANPNSNNNTRSQFVNTTTLPNGNCSANLAQNHNLTNNIHNYSQNHSNNGQRFSLVNGTSSLVTQPHHDYIHHSPVYSCVSPATSPIINNQLYANNRDNSPNNMTQSSATQNSSTSAMSYLSTSCNISALQQSMNQHHHHHHHQSGPTSVQTQLHPQGMTVTLIATIPSVTSTSAQNTNNSSQILTATPLMPIMQPLSQTPSQLPNTPSPSVPPVISPTVPNTSPLMPSTSAVSSSSSSPISSAQNLSSTTRDWFTYVYKIENIEDLIKNHESQQNFVQSPIFSFTNHIINTSNKTGNNSSQSSGSQQTSNFSSSNSQYSNNSIGGSGGIGVPIYTTNSSSSSSSSSSSNLTTDLNNNLSNNVDKNGISNKQPSNWRLIFYPNGAGTDCKNFLSIFLKYLSDEPVKIQMMFSIVDNMGEDVYVKYTVNKFFKSNDWGFKQLIHKNAILYQKEKFLKPYNGGTLSVRVKMRLDEQKHDYIKKLNDNLHYCKLLSENFSQYYYNNNMLKDQNTSASESTTDINNNPITTTTTCLASSSTQPSASPSSLIATSSCSSAATSSSYSPSSSINNSNCPNSVNFSQSKSLLNNNSSNQSTLNGTHNFSNSAESNSSYYDILLLVKSNSEYTSSHKLCANCIESNETLSKNLQSKNNNNRRSHAALDSDSDNYQNSKRMKLSNSTSMEIQQSSDPTHSSKCSCHTLNSNDTIDKTEITEFRAHKCILAARSPVFKAMFNYKLKENLTNKVIIEDCKPDVVKAMLKYIYTAYLPDDIKSIAIDLYIAAEKYFIESLKIKCREFLIENLNTDLVVQIYILAELYNDSMLRKQSLKYISENIDKVTQDQDWNEFMVEYPQLFTNAFIRLCKKDF